jgi:hypothetical protein
MVGRCRVLGAGVGLALAGRVTLERVLDRKPLDGAAYSAAISGVTVQVCRPAAPSEALPTGAPVGAGREFQVTPASAQTGAAGSTRYTSIVRFAADETA